MTAYKPEEIDEKTIAFILVDNIPSNGDCVGPEITTSK
jgi:hypothetical protein